MSYFPRGPVHGYNCNCDRCWAKVARDNIAYGKKQVHRNTNVNGTKKLLGQGHQ